jgi:lysophospholipase L1-like esterase
VPQTVRRAAPRGPLARARRRGAVAAALTATLTTLTASLATLAALATFAAGGAQAATGPYVALGDSYTAAPLVPTPTGSPILCGRSTSNYPQDVRRSIAPSSFTDASCSSATTADMTQSQSLEGGVQTAPPQFNALAAGDALVTLGIGGNDAGLIGVAEECAKLDVAWPFGHRCRDHYTSGGTDTEVARITATGPRVAAVIQGIHARAPKARVLVVGYPVGLPQNGSTCYPVVPFSSGDVTYFNSLEQRLNTVIKQAAQANGATYVDTFTSSIGHDACAGAGAWVNGIIPTSAAFPLHPNKAGEANMAAQVEGSL